MRKVAARAKILKMPDYDFERYKNSVDIKFKPEETTNILETVYKRIPNGTTSRCVVSSILKYKTYVSKIVFTTDERGLRNKIILTSTGCKVECANAFGRNALENIGYNTESIIKLLPRINQMYNNIYIVIPEDDVKLREIANYIEQKLNQKKQQRQGQRSLGLVNNA